MSVSDSECFYPDIVLPELHAQNTAQVIKVLAEYIARQSMERVCVTDIEDIMTAQEAQSPSGIGEGVAIVQMTMDVVDKPFLLVSCLGRVTDMASVDREPVDLLVCLVSPKADTGPLHLRRLSRISRLMRDREFCDCLRSAETEDAMRAIWHGAEQLRRAA